jgi:filamentous hemagglutinin family protein
MVYSMKNKQLPNFSLRKLILTALVSGTVATVPAPLWAVPDLTSANLTTSSSAVVVSLSGNSVSITAPDKSVLSWKDFGAAGSPINAGDTLNYFLPTASASVLNLVTGGNTSTINGTIASNGNVYLLNSNGITIGGTAQINTGGFYASTINDSLASNSFQQTGTILTAGPVSANITVANGAALQALGSGNNIKLYGKQVNVDGGNFYGNLTVTSYNSGANGASFGGSANPVTVNQVNAAGGNLTVVTNGGNIVLSGGAGGTLNVAGTTTLDSTGAAAVGSIATGVAAFNGTAFNATATNSLGSANITVGSGKVTSLTATGNNISVTVANGAAMAVNNVTAAGTLTL